MWLWETALQRGLRPCQYYEEGAAVYLQFRDRIHGLRASGSIGACIADHTHDIILVTGDGSIQMNLQELQTIITINGN